MFFISNGMLIIFFLIFVTVEVLLLIGFANMKKEQEKRLAKIKQIRKENDENRFKVVSD